MSNFCHFWWILAYLKNHPKNAFLKTPPKSILSRHVSPPWPPKIDLWWFWYRFWLHFGLPFSSKFRYVSKLAETTILLEKQWKINDFPPSRPPISTSISDQIFTLFPNAFQNLFFPPFDRPGAPKSRRIDFFGPFLAPGPISRGPKNRPKSTKWRQNAEKKVRRPAQNRLPGIDLFPRSLSDRSWAPFWSISGPPWLQNHWFLHDFSTHFDQILGIIFFLLGCPKL